MCVHVHVHIHIVDLLVGIHRRLCLCVCLCVGLLLITAVHSLPMILYHYTGEWDDCSNDGR